MTEFNLVEAWIVLMLFGMYMMNRSLGDMKKRIDQLEVNVAQERTIWTAKENSKKK